MPAHQVSAPELVATLHRLERQHEQPVTVVPYGQGYVIVTRLVDANVTRLAAVTHAARVGAEWDRDPLLHSFLTDHIVVDEVTG